MWKLLGMPLLLFAVIGAAAAPGPYAGLQDREIKALSSTEIRDYLDGKGMGYAKAAELNHYPGPLHVLDLADKLGLTPEQKGRSQKIFTRMQHEAKRAGKALVDKERELDRRFAHATIDTATLRAVLDEIGKLQADVRRTHLQAHLEQRAVLTPAQIAAYDTLRGYAAGGSADDQRHRHAR